MFIWVARFFGFCGHDIQWGDPERGTVDGWKCNIQKGRCSRCGLQKVREVWLS